MSNVDVASAMVNNLLDEHFKHVKNCFFKPEWISVKDRLPDHNQFVLAIGKSGIMEVVRCDLHINNKPLDYIFMNLSLTHQITGITHWHPLPALPKTSENT